MYKFINLHNMIFIVLSVGLTVSFLLGYTPVLISVLFLLASIFSYFLYAKDKRAAEAGSWRVSEKTLHLSALFFGWPGALFAQERLRHKTQKKSFRLVFWITLILNIGVLVWLHTPKGNQILQNELHALENLVIKKIDHKGVVSVILFLTHIRQPIF